jgi:hypothetical protein
MTTYTVSGIPSSQTRASSSQVRGEFVLVATAVNSKGDVAGQTWIGTHDYSGGLLRVATPVGTADAVTKAYADGLSFATTLPAQTGNAGKIVTTNGTTASWAALYFQTAATSAELKTGTDNAKVATASGLLAAQGFTAYFQSSDQTITSAGALTIAHGLGRVPVKLTGHIKNVTAEAGYVTGDVIETAIIYNSAASAIYGAVLTCDATNIYVRFSSPTTVFFGVNKGNGAGNSFTNANWSFLVRAFA